MNGNIIRWLQSSAGLQGRLHWRQVAGGLSNITYVVTDETGRRVVVRRPPEGQLTGGAHDVLREARILAALRSTAVPVPAVLAVCPDLAVAGVPFYVMEHAAGAVLDSAESARRFTLPQRRRLGFELIDVLSGLQAVDLDAVGLATMRRGTPYLERQIRRWNAQWTATASRVVPAINDVSSRLQKILPTLSPQPDCLVHGDFRFGNVMVTDGRRRASPRCWTGSWPPLATRWPISGFSARGCGRRPESLSPAPTRRPSMAFPPTAISLTVSTSAPACQSPTWRCSSR